MAPRSGAPVDPSVIYFTTRGAEEKTVAKMRPGSVIVDIASRRPIGTLSVRVLE